MYFPQTNTPRWIIFLIDLSFCILAVLLAFMLRFNFKIPLGVYYLLKLNLIIIPSIRALSFIIGKTYAGIVRYTGSKDAQRIFMVNTITTLLFVGINIISYYFVIGEFILPFSIVIIEYMATVFLMITFRIIIKVLYSEIKNPKSEKRNVVIFGAGESGVITKRAIDRDARSRYNVIAFIDDDVKKQGKKIEGAEIFSSNKLGEILAKNDVAHLIISVQQLSAERKKEIIETALQHNVKVLNVPPVDKWINGELSFKQIKKIKIEDLLERDPIQLDYAAISKQIKDKVVLVTGAAGSIGSEIVRQALRFNPKKIILLDQAETPLFELELELNEKYNQQQFEAVIGDIKHSERMENVFKTFRPQIVFHAAAYKHVPLMELNPSEAVLTNVLGTKVVADLAHKYHCEKFVLISTDKAVNPSSVMGASKRIAEKYVQSLNEHSQTKFITTRFGNVLGSNGSVITLFRRQIEKGGPITITHPEITRYFMTIPEACQLVLEAGAMGNGGEVFIFDMGQSVKIVDLAKKMIKLSGLELDKDIKIVYTGLRPGEKLYEELLTAGENNLPTHHKQILIAKVSTEPLETINKDTEKLISLFEKQDNFAIVEQMKKMVPEFKSNNSVYSQLDKIKH
ncbi:MAG: polysaccharide biosynthesis protein [Bacteroidia bacterium]